MKLKLSLIHPNPNKKKINQGKLNREQIKKIKSNIEKLGFFGSLPIVKINDRYYLVSGHHRHQALLETYGKDYEVEVDLKKYNDEQILRGMVIENLTQRTGDFQELKENILLVEDYLNKHPKSLNTLRESRNIDESRQKLPEMQKAVAKDISIWIDNATGDIISHDVITEMINIARNLNPELVQEVRKKHDKGFDVRSDNSLNYTQAVMLSSINNHKEQKQLAKALKKSQEQRVREQGKLLSVYKTLDDNNLEEKEIKQKVKKGELDLKDLPVEKFKLEIKQKVNQIKKDPQEIRIVELKRLIRQGENLIGKTNGEIIQTCAFFESLIRTNLLYELDWNTVYDMLEVAQKRGSQYVKFIEKIRNKL